jgi:hypothetical protein
VLQSSVLNPSISAMPVARICFETPGLTRRALLSSATQHHDHPHHDLTTRRILPSAHE